MALLIYLAVTGQPHGRDELATLFYPRHAQSSARSNLRRDLFELKSSLDDHVLLLEREQISLISPEKLWVDVNEFLGHVDYVRLHHQSQQADRQSSICEDCMVRLTKSIELYSDDFMSGFTISGSREFEDWQFFQSENLRRTLAEILPRLINWHSERSELEQSINYGRRWLSLDPLHEPAQREMMRLYALSGQQTAALRQYTEFKHLLNSELGSEPDEQTDSLFEAIRNHQIDVPIPRGAERPVLLPGRYIPSLLHNNLPIPDESLIGRVRELDLIVQKLRDDPDCRVLTLVGPGGIGKTRLAIEAAFRLAEDAACPFCEGIFYISLAALSSPDAILLAIADALKLPLLPDPDQRNQQMLNYLQTKRLLLLLDNFEQLIGSRSIQVLVDVLSHAPQVKFLVTSRARLNTHSEYVVPLQGLDIPATPVYDQDISIDTTIEGYSAIRLFSTRAKQIKPEFNITINDLKSIIQICQILEGMPLGIELAVAWLDVLTPAEIMAEIAQCLDFLTVNWPDKPERHQSLRAVFDSSWKLLGEAERAALMNLTVFQSSFSRQAAQAVSGASIQVLMSLHSKSLLQVQENNRYQIHELLCQYANEYLQAEPGTWQVARKRFCTYYADFLNQQSEYIKGTQQSKAFDSISVEFENIRLAWQWLVESNQVELAVQCLLPALFRYAEVRAMPFELYHFLDIATEAVAKDTNSLINPRLQSILIVARAAFNNYDEPLRLGLIYAMRNQEQAIHQVWRMSGDVKTLKTMDFWGILLAFLYGRLVDTQDGARCLGELITLLREENRQWELAYALYLLGAVLFASLKNYTDTLSDQEEAANLYKEALKIFQELGDKSESGYTMCFIGQLYHSQGRYLEAIEQWKEAQSNLRDVGEWVFSATLIMDISDDYIRLGDYESAFEGFQSMRLVFAEMGHKLAYAQALSTESILALRYSDIHHALQTRQESLEQYQEAGNALGIAWANWEMGEINRVAGDLPGAKMWYEKARILFDNLEDRSSPIFIHRGLGDIAQATGDFAEAKKHFQESKQLSEKIDHQWAQIYALCGLGRAEIALGDVEAAWSHFSEALQISQDIGETGLALISLAGYVSIFALIGKSEQAIELGTLVIHHKHSWNETKAQMLALLQTIKPISPDQFSAAQERGRHLDIGEAIRRFDLQTE